jgi:heme/copper-type cytochrome/quinol oxidase subunit 3
MFLSLKMMRSGNPSSSKLYLSITLALGLAFSFSQYSGWNDLAQIGSGWGTESNEEGLVAYSWNRINELVQSDAVYGVDYDVRINDTPLLYNADTKEFYAPNDPLMVRAITSDVIHITNSSASYIWALILIHLLHLTFGIIYVVVNLIRVSKGIINPGDTVRLRVLSTYWHFLGGLWLLLFFVLFL